MYAFKEDLIIMLHCFSSKKKIKKKHLLLSKAFYDTLTIKEFKVKVKTEYL